MTDAPGIVDAAAPPSEPATAAAPGKAGLGKRAARGTAVSLGGQLVLQLLKLGSNLVLTRLLDPDAFGLMAIVLAVTNGLALVSDVGVWQAIVQSPRGDDRDFLDTAWSLHVVRGVGLFALGCAGAWPAAEFYGRLELLWMLPLCAFQAVLQGAESTKHAQASRHLQVGRVVVIDLVTQVVGLCVSIPVGFALHSAFALVAASLASALVRMVMTHTFFPGPMNRFRWEKAAITEIFNFGRYIFISTIFYFIGTRYDVFALGRLQGMTVIGVYGLAQMIVQVPTQMGERVTYFVLLPALSERFRESPKQFGADVRHARMILLPAAAVLFLGAAMTAPAFFKLLYREVYVDAGWMVQLLVLTAWATFMQESTGRALMAIGDSAPLAITNFVRVVVTIGTTTLGFELGKHVPYESGPLVGFMLGYSVGALVGAFVMGHGLAKRGASVHAIDAVGTLLFVAVGLVGCGGPVLLERFTGWPSAYTTLAAVFVLLGPIALVVAKHTRDAIRRNRSA